MQNIFIGFPDINCNVITKLENNVYQLISNYSRESSYLICTGTYQECYDRHFDDVYNRNRELYVYIDKPCFERI